MPKFGTKNISCGYFRARIKKKTIAIFEIAPSILSNGKISQNYLGIFGLEFETNLVML